MRRSCYRFSARTGRSGVLFRLGTTDRGAEILEAALAIPLVVMLLIGMIWLGRAYNVAQTMTRAAREGARLAVAPSCATCGNSYPADSQVRAVVDASLSASSLNATQVSGYALQRGVVLNPGSAFPETGVAISFSYPFQLVIPFTSVNMTNIAIRTRVQMRQE